MAAPTEWSAGKPDATVAAATDAAPKYFAHAAASYGLPSAGWENSYWPPLLESQMFTELTVTPDCCRVCESHFTKVGLSTTPAPSCVLPAPVSAMANGLP